MSNNWVIRRPQRADLAAVADFYNLLRPADPPICAQDILRSLCQTGYLVAWLDERLMGVLRWRAENLVALVLEALVDPLCTSEAVGRLLAEAEAQARQLSCEVLFLFVDGLIEELAAVMEAQGYVLPDGTPWPTAWREATGAAGTWRIKRLLERRILAPF